MGLRGRPRAKPQGHRTRSSRTSRSRRPTRPGCENLRGKNIHNGAAAVIDYRTGEVLAYVGSGSYTSAGDAKFQPQYDVLSDGWRQPGSSIKPINYAIGIDDKTMTASTMFMDVVTDFGRGFTPTQADNLERGPVRLRSALQFSLNIPSIKAGIINGLDHFYERSKDFGIEYIPGSVPVVSMGIGTLEVHPIDLLGAYGAIANGGVLMPRTTILKVTDSDGRTVYPAPTIPMPKATEVISPQAAYIITDILAGNTSPKTNPFWGEWAVYDGRTRRPAAYKTGTTNDNRDIHAYGYLAPPEDPTLPALAVGVWMGNSNNEPNTDTLSLASSAPLWSRIMRDVSKDLPIEGWHKPSGLEVARVDAFSGMKPGPFSTKIVDGAVHQGHGPQGDRRLPPIRRRSTARAACSGRTAASGPRRRSGRSTSAAYEDIGKWGYYNRGWQKRAAKGRGVSGGPEGTRTSYFYGSGFFPYGSSWGGIFAPTELCPIPAPPPRLLRRPVPATAARATNRPDGRTRPRNPRQDRGRTRP